jgi:hypothetical protein
MLKVADFSGEDAVRDATKVWVQLEWSGVR